MTFIFWYTYKFRFSFNENIGNNIGFFSVFDGHSGDLTVKFIHNYVEQNLLIKIKEASRLINNSTEPYNKTDCKTDSEYYAKKLKTIIPLNERSDEFMKFYNTAYNCLWNQSCSMNTIGFRNKMFETISNIKNKTYEQEKNYPAKCYVESGKINYTKMILDELLLIDYNVLMMAKKLVR